MSAENVWETPCWFVIHTHAKQENRVEYNLRAWNVETFAPKIRARRINYYTGKPSFFTRPMFPRYIFARFIYNDLHHKISFTRGVHGLISFNDVPTPVDDDIIDLIKSNVREDGFVKIGEELYPGDRVTILEGPLANFTGVFEREMEEADRVKILLDTVSYQAHAVLERQQVKKLDKAG